MTEEPNGIAFLFSVLLFPELLNKSKEETIEYVDVIKDSGKITEEEYQKALEFLDNIYDLKETIKKELKQDGSIGKNIGD